MLRFLTPEEMATRSDAQIILQSKIVQKARFKERRELKAFWFCSVFMNRGFRPYFLAEIIYRFAFRCSFVANHHNI